MIRDILNTSRLQVQSNSEPATMLSMEEILLYIGLSSRKSVKESNLEHSVKCGQLYRGRSENIGYSGRQKIINP